jgi:ribonucleoside-diphosphate reductase alpha chain
LSHAFNAWTLGEAAIDRLGMADQAGKPGFDLLTALGLTKAQVTALNRVICGTQTVEGAPHLKDEHLAVFDCASTCGPTGKRFIAPNGHIQMMAAAQPFISGAISKTINLPNSANVQDIKDAYRLSWELGLKANALYRDGCKLSQVLNNKADADDGVEDEEAIEAAKEEVTAEVAAVAEAASAGASKAQPAADRQPVEKIIERIVERPLRRRLPDTRMGKTHKFNVAGHEGYLTVGLYEDGTPGELFITMAKEGSTIGGLMDSLGTAISVALQYGVPVESLVNKFTHQRFEPAGITHNPEIPFAKSLVDYIFRWLGMEFVPGYRAANAPARSKPQPEPKPAERAAAEATEGANGNGHSNGNGGKKSPIHPKPAPLGATDAAAATAVMTQTLTEGQRSALVSAMSQMQADAPACDACGTITVRNGTCYKCLNCGASMGCS